MSGSSDRSWLAGALALFLLAGIPFWEYRTDDTFIFLRYARNLAAGDGPSFNPGEPVYGFTSPLWLLVLAALHRLGVGSLFAAKLLSIVAGAGAVLGMHRFARQRLARPWAIAATACWAANAWLVRWTASAMDTALVVCLAVWSLALWEEERRDASRPPLAALLLGLLVLARPEGALLAALALGLTLLDREGGGPRRALVGAAIIGALVLPWLLYARATMGTILPVTGAAKGTVGLAVGLDALVDVARIVVTTSGLECVAMALALALALATTAARRRAGASEPGMHALPLLWLLILPLFYAATGFDVLSRYALPVLPVVVAYGFVAAGALPAGAGWRVAAATLCGAAAGMVTFLLQRDHPGGGAARIILPAALVAAGLGLATAARTETRRQVLIACLVVVWNGGVLARVVYPHTHAFSRGVTDCFQQMGEWFAEHTPPGAQVAIADIGAFGYYSDRRVLDLAALVSPELIPIVDRYSIQEIAAGLRFAGLARPDYLIDRHRRPGRLARAMHGLFEPLELAPCGIAGLGVRSPETIYYTAYRLRWDRYDPGVEPAVR